MLIRVAYIRMSEFILIAVLGPSKRLFYVKAQLAGLTGYTVFTHLSSNFGAKAAALLSA